MKPGKVGFTESPMDTIAQSLPFPLPKLLPQPDTRSPDLSYQFWGRVSLETLSSRKQISIFEKHTSNQMLLTGPLKGKKNQNMTYVTHGTL